VSYYPLTLEVSKEQKKELLLLMKSTLDKEEYRRAYALKQKMEGVPYRTIAKDMGVNYRNMYDWIDNYRKDGLNGIRNKRKSGGRKPLISTAKKQGANKRYRTEQITKDIWLSKKYMEYQTFGYLFILTSRNQCQSFSDVEDNP